MSSTSTELLRLLGSLSAPPSPAASASAPADRTGFASLLQKAQQGTIASGRPVTIKPEANLKLTDEQLARVAAAADRAESQGAMRAAVLIDGKALTLDVQSREITGQTDLDQLAVATGIDAVVAAPPPTQPTPTPLTPGISAAPVPLPQAGPGYGNPSLLRVLSQSLGSKRAG